MTTPQVPPPPPGTRLLGGQLHPAAIAVWSTGHLGALLIVLLINPSALPMLALLLGLSVMFNAVRYTRFRWTLDDRQLVISQGLLRRERRIIPVERVQSVDLVRRPAHRVFNVVGVNVEAIGAGDTQGRLDALAPGLAQQLRSTLLERRAHHPGRATGDAAEVGEGRLLARVPTRRLVLAGATEANATLVAAAAGGLWQLFGDRFDELAGRLPELVGATVLPVVVIAVVLVAITLLIAAQVVLYWGFNLRRSDGALVVRRGLLEQRFDTIPLQRVQAVRIEENLPRRLLGLAGVRADVAGKPGGGSQGTDTLLPLGKAGEARALASDILDCPDLASLELQPMPLRARARRRVRAVLAVAVLTAGAAAWWGIPGLAAALLIVPAFAVAGASYRALGHAELHGIVVCRAGWWIRRTAFVPDDRLHEVRLRASLFQRRRRLATVELGIPRYPGLWSGPQIIDIDHQRGGGLLEAYGTRAAGRRPDDQ